MEYISSKQIGVKVIEQVCFDVFIAASGYESRCSWLIDNHKIKAEKKLALAFTEKRGKLNRKKNNSNFRNHNFDFLDISGDDFAILEQYFKNLLREIESDSLKILVDYSCMTKLWYASIINYLINEEEKFENIDVYFSYTPAEFNRSRKIKPATRIDSLSVGQKKFDPSKPTALIMGLGIEKGLSEFVYQKIKPEHCSLMYADPALDDKYVQDVFENNQDVINLIDVKYLVSYPLNDLEKTDEILTNLGLQLRLKYNVIIVSLGPKVFSLNCLLLATRYPDIDVWRITAAQNTTVIDRIPSGDPFLLKVRFSNQDEEY